MEDKKLYRLPSHEESVCSVSNSIFSPIHQNSTVWSQNGLTSTIGEFSITGRNGNEDLSIEEKEVLSKIQLLQMELSKVNAV